MTLHPPLTRHVREPPAPRRFFNRWFASDDGGTNHVGHIALGTYLTSFRELDRVKSGKFE
jgi:hypothetical protein